MRRPVPLAPALAAAALLLAAPSGRAEPPAPAAAPGPSVESVLRLPLSEAIALGVQNNLDVEVERHDPLIARETLGIAWGAFDPELGAEYGLADTETPTASALQAGNLTTNRMLDGSAGLRGLVPVLGASYELAYTAARTETNFIIERLSPRYDAGVVASLRMPLLRDLVWNEPWTAVRRARIGISAADDAFRIRLMDTVRTIEDAYWGLIAAREQRRVADKSLETARALLEQTKTQYEVGVVSRVEVTEAEAGVAEREVALITADNAWRNAQDVLIDQVLGPRLTAASTLQIEPTDDPGQITIRDVDADEALRKALARRPELAAAQADIEDRRIAVAFARNQRLPQLDVAGSFGFLGLSGRQNPDFVSFGGPPSPLTVGPRFEDAHDDFFDDDGARQWSVRGFFSVPLGNVRGRHDVSARELELRRARTVLRRLEQTIVLEIRAAARNLRSAVEGIEAAERRQAAAAEQLRAERVRLEQGESTPFDVLLRERDLVEAESQRIEAERVYHASVAALDRAQGTLLSRHNILVEEAARLR